MTDAERNRRKGDALARAADHLDPDGAGVSGDDDPPLAVAAELRFYAACLRTLADHQEWEPDHEDETTSRKGKSPWTDASS